MNRRVTILLLCGAFAATGVALPIVLGPDPVHASTINALHGLGGLGFFGAVLSLFGLAGASEETSGSKTQKPAPRTLDRDLLGAAPESVPLERRIEAAAEASKQHGRTVGVIYYNVDAYRQVARADGAEAAEAMMEAIVMALRPRLRKTDRVERLGKGRFVVVIVLLPEKAALESINKRLDAAIRAARPEVGSAIDVGMSIYPLGGYTGEELIATACNHSDAQHEARLRTGARQRRAAAA